MAQPKKVIMENLIAKFLRGFRRTKKITAEKWQSHIVESVRDYTMGSPSNILSLINAIRYITENNIKGDIVECGVWKGGSMMAAAETLIHLNDYSRKLYLYDTFEYFSQPGPMDISYRGESGYDVLKQNAGDGETWKAPEESTVLKNIMATGYPADLLKLIKGKVEDTIPGTIPENISILRLDTDWYASTKHELEWLYPALTERGVLIIDDYGHWKGCKKAVDDYFEIMKIEPSFIIIDYSAKLFYKPKQLIPQ
jgi:O-methyltransferase